MSTTPKAPAASLSPKPPTGNNAAWDADEDERPLGNPADVKDEGVLKSLGKAISSPVLEADDDKRGTAADRALKK